MSTVIMDSCSYTQQGLIAYLTSRGISKRRILGAKTIAELATLCKKSHPYVVFINEDCFIHDTEYSQQIKKTISQHATTLFFVFITIANTGFNTYLRVKKNLLISSKSINPALLDQILGDYINGNMQRINSLNIPILTLSRTESCILKLWMAGQDTNIISEMMQVKPKTVSSHKGNIKRKIKTHNKKVIFHLARITESITNGITVNLS